MDQFAVFRIAKFKRIGDVGVRVDRRRVSAGIYKAKAALNEDLADTLGITVDGSKSRLQGSLRSGSLSIQKAPRWNGKAPKGCVRDMGSLYGL